MYGHAFKGITVADSWCLRFTLTAAPVRRYTHVAVTVTVISVTHLMLCVQQSDCVVLLVAFAVQNDATVPGSEPS
jgi:hypothetical protein